MKANALLMVDLLACSATADKIEAAGFDGVVRLSTPFPKPPWSAIHGETASNGTTDDLASADELTVDSAAASLSRH